MKTSELTTITEQPSEAYRVTVPCPIYFPSPWKHRPLCRQLVTMQGTSYEDMSVEDHGHVKVLTLYDSRSKPDPGRQHSMFVKIY